MTDHIPKFDCIPRLQQIAATIKERGAGTFDAPATAAYYINCAIKEIERLHRDYSCICNEMRRMMDERDETRRELAMMAVGRAWVEAISQDALDYAARRGWDCFPEVTP